MNKEQLMKMIENEAFTNREKLKLAWWAFCCILSRYSEKSKFYRLVKQLHGGYNLRAAVKRVEAGL